MGVAVSLPPNYFFSALPLSLCVVRGGGKKEKRNKGESGRTGMGEFNGSLSLNFVKSSMFRSVTNFTIL